ncbi:hypothetical protein GCM10008938_04170 [Deinococcus roseus]|uniref:Proteinase inhibitor I42 chagasin domain-containing protein n=2 Tax=Deinococcus roseus TaxID=392414 RepID=A0ABQ2CVR6_9DEIO|nr:hypothetical protein GCM10008938_04170 [Deinococcus roseus]
MPQATPPLQIYVQEQISKNSSVAQTITFELPDGFSMTIPLGNIKGWQKITEPSRCTNPEQKITVTFTPNENHSKVGYGFKCGDMIKNATVVFFAQKTKKEVLFGERSYLTPAMKKAVEIPR